MEVLHAGDLVVNVGYRCFCSFGVRFIFVRRVDFHRLGSFMHCHAVKITREVFGPFRLFQTRRRESVVRHDVIFKQKAREIECRTKHETRNYYVFMDTYIHVVVIFVVTMM
jgi:hypothetical protein